MKTSKPNIDIIITVVTPNSLEVTTTTPIGWDPDAKEIRQATIEAIATASSIDRYIQAMPERKSNAV
jgi:hypothetical protein